MIYTGINGSRLGEQLERVRHRPGDAAGGRRAGPPHLVNSCAACRDGLHGTHRADAEGQQMAAISEVVGHIQGVSR